MIWRIGCSGFHYKEWKEVFYPKGITQKNWFSYYCEHFNTIEINSSFYKMPTQQSFEKWYNESPDNFLFTIKAPRSITHYKQLRNCHQFLDNFYTTVNQGLHDKLGCILFQFPPTFKYTEDRLNLLLSVLDPAFNNVVEFRHPTWWNDDIYIHLANHGIIFSGQSFPGALPNDVVKNHSIVYYRFHGTPILYKSEYPLNTMVDFAAQVPDATEQAFVYFNNTWGTGALVNSKQLLEIVNA